MKTGIKSQNLENEPPSSIAQIKIELEGIQPPIWRRVLVPVNLTLHDLHLIIQAAMGWDNYHLYEFSLGRQRFAFPWPDEPIEGTIDSRKAKIEDFVASNKKVQLNYMYDFGDGWLHKISIEKVLSKLSREKYPKCIAGMRSCPLEDCGSVPGYYELVAAFANKNDKKYKELREWTGGKYDPEYLDLKEADLAVRDYKDMEAEPD